MYNGHLWFTGKRVVDLLLVLIELFSLDDTAEVVRANIYWKSDRSDWLSLTQNFR